MKLALTLFMLLFAANAFAQDAIIVGANGDRTDDGNGAGASLHWVRSRADTTLIAGALVASFPGTRWRYAVAGGSRKLNARTMLTGEANIGNGDDARGSFRYLLLRGGGTYDVLPRKLSAEAEWLHVDVARQRDGVLRLGATATLLPRLVLRLSRYESLAGDGDTSLLTMRGDYDLGRMRPIIGFAYGHAGTVFSQQTGSDATRVRDLFGGATFRGWTLVVTAGHDRQSIAVSRRIALPFGGSP